jgi:hypothetical protein
MPEVGFGKGWTEEDRQLRRSIQGDCGEAKQSARSAGGGRRRSIGHSSVHTIAVAQAGKGESDRARASKLDVETTAELRRFRKLERRYKVLKRAQIQHWFIGAFGAVVLGVGIYLVHRQVERRIDQIGKL